MKMSPASKSKSKDKRPAKEPLKSSSKPSGPSNSSTSNPPLGSFHTIETAQNSSATLPHQVNSRILSGDETCENGGPGGLECDSISNNGSWSGESEDHKEKSSNPPARHETIPPGADSGKREKIRQKNEKKHQRQKERRAQELHERCSGYLMSQKLEILAQQLVAMGFSHERATMALMLNEGKVEESVSWLFEGGEDADKQVDQSLSVANLKIDISDELTKIADMEIRYKCSKQEVERAIVSTEGDLEKAEEILQKQKQDATYGPQKLQETGDSPNSKHSVSQNSKLQSKPVPAPSNLPKRDESDFNYSKLGATSVVAGASELGLRAAQPITRTVPKLEWGKPQLSTVPAEKWWPLPGSTSYSLASLAAQASHPQAKPETHYMASRGEVKNFQNGSVQEPVIMMQRPQSANSKQVPLTHIGSPTGSSSSWFPVNGLEMTQRNGMLPQFSGTSNRNIAQSSSIGGSSHDYNQLHYPQQYSNGFGDFPGVSHGTANASWNRVNATPTVAAVSSLGLFSGLGSSTSSGAASPVDWMNGGSSIQLDYTNIDWTLNQGIPSRPGNLWLGLENFMRNSADRGYDLNAGVDSKPVLRPAFNGNGVPSPFLGLQNPGAETAGMDTREWTSPFEGRDLFSLPRRYVSSPPPL
ncbi:hypothetical protein SAY86_019626 [Trapa natans]|uniref:UBA domain-containing protein n=1 Tax=Trapa natans TaxID=22666 RepID=A0AAN7LKV2_TRANT|nr:hypothetical protein SAY86_019626 [Trapa natans]